MAEGTILRKEVIADDVLSWGNDYAKSLNEAIAKNKEFVESVVLLNEMNKALRASANQKDLIDNLKRLNEPPRARIELCRSSGYC